MAISYPKIGKAIALRAGQIGDAIDAATFNTAYEDTALETAMAGVDLPFGALKYDILNVEREIATMIGNSTNNLLRRALLGEKVIEYGSVIPLTDGRGIPFFGKPEGLFRAPIGDAELAGPLQLMDKQVVLRRIRNAGGFYKLKHDIYCIDGTTILFDCSDGEEPCQCGSSRRTCNCRAGDPAEAYFRGCVWSYTAAEAAFDAGGNSVMPEQVAQLWQAKVLAGLAQENWFVNEASQYAQIADRCARDIGLWTDPGAMPDVVVTNTENRNAASQNR